MATERLTARNSRGERLAGILHLPAGDGRRPLIVSCPGLMSSKDGTKHVALGAAAEARGLALLRLDYSGIGESEGEFAASVMTQRVEDAGALLHAALRRLPATPAVAFAGSSFGAPVALLCAARECQRTAPRVAAVVTWAATCDFAAVLAGSEPRHLAALRRGETVRRAEEGRTYVITPAFLDDFATYRFADCLAALGGVATLFAHGKRDDVVPYAQSEQLHAWARGLKRLVLFEEGSHGLHEVLPALLDLTLEWCCKAFARA
ncbi:MAG: alpha/beta hydrolase [Candidatus Tectomicrobia bacterium]|nr:alpha/beta hydrolase [Candidatus Tectomicrobia bacterium]